MTSREEIINSLNACMDVHQSGLWSSGCMLCAYEKQSNPKCFMNLTKDAVALLREQPEIVRCKDCIHRGHYDEKLHCVVYPDEKCPALCDDPFYSWRPDDDWFCPNGETME